MYTTTADEHRDKAIEHIKEAISELSEIIVNQCSGHNDFREEYKNSLKEMMNTLIELRDQDDEYAN